MIDHGLIQSHQCSFVVIPPAKAVGVRHSNFQPNNGNMPRILLNRRPPCFPKLLLQPAAECGLAHTSRSKYKNQGGSGWLLDRLPELLVGFFEVWVGHHFFPKICQACR